MDKHDAFAIRALRDANHEDSHWACDAEIGADGTARVVPLTVKRLEDWALRYWYDPFGPTTRAHFSMAPAP